MTDLDSKPDTEIKYPYHPDLGDVLYDLMAQGYTATAACSFMQIPPRRLYAWADQHPEFADKMDLARAARIRFLEDRLRSADSSPQVTASIFSLKTAGDGNIGEWKERGEINRVELTGKDGTPLLPDGADDNRKLARAIVGILGASRLTDAGEMARVINHDDE